MSYEHRWNDTANREGVVFGDIYFDTVIPAQGCTQDAGSIVGVTGPDTAFDAPKLRRLAELPDDLIVLAEIARLPSHWATPGDLDVGDVSPSIVSGPEGDGVYVVFADSSVWFLDSRLPVNVLKCFLTIKEAQRHEREELLAEYGYAIFPASS